MTKDDVDFDTWFSALCSRIKEKSGVTFRDSDSVRDDFEQGKDALALGDEIADEYNE